MLESIGIGPHEERIYEELVAGPAADERELADRTGLAEPDVEQALAQLAHRGLVVVRPEQQHRLHAAPPDITLRLMALQRLDDLHKAQLAIAQLSQRYQRSGTPGGGTEPVEVVEGATAIAERYGQLQRNARREIQSLVAAPVIAVPPTANAGQQDALRAGVRYRVVYERTTLEGDGQPTPLLLDEWAALGEEMRVAIEVPFKGSIFDEEVVLVVLRHLPPGAAAKALVVHTPALVEALCWVFRRVWESAVPVPTALATPADGPLAPDDRRLLSLLLAGYTDQAIATQVGVSMRTIQRRVQRLLVLAGVQTRIQLGWQAARRRWI
ncbi:Sugar-specific transcriptional regulator TrmB [Micromonospora pallida]|uniref:Sugar-specific transcriptional regulator TrmB n=1 Tax=Micromonospora pallida TaxID=145854 RepID=A0A1C6RXG8_9ACTN|nr:helix-turn-helix domain-containing protein [Micromonospora pallida]SCL21730.1 Sugar-specific transcriptional regulator TrmB [Micromonospora pallida]